MFRHLLAVCSEDGTCHALKAADSEAEVIRRVLESLYDFFPLEPLGSDEDEHLDFLGQPIDDNVVDVWENPSLEGLKALCPGKIVTATAVQQIWNGHHIADCGYTHRLFWTEVTPFHWVVIKTFPTHTSALHMHLNSLKKRGITPLVEDMRK